MPEAHEQIEHAEHIEHAGGVNKKIALVIAIMALFLAFSEVLGKSAQTEAMNLNIKASDLWNFFQAKNIRRTVVLTAAEAKKAEATAAAEVQAREPIAQQIAQWEKTAARYRSEPETGEGTVELSERAKHTEHERDTKLAQYHNYELASAHGDTRLARRRRRGGRHRPHRTRPVRAASAAFGVSLGVARIERSEIRGRAGRQKLPPGFAPLNPGYEATKHSHRIFPVWPSE
jgi:hypothetical protein